MQVQQKNGNYKVIESVIWVRPQFPFEHYALTFPLSTKLSLIVSTCSKRSKTPVSSVFVFTFF